MRGRTIAVLLAGLVMSTPSTTTTAAAAIVRVSATRQDSISRIPSLRKMKLAIYQVILCSDTDITVPGGRVFQALHAGGLPTESDRLAPYIATYAADHTLLGYAVSAGESAGPAGAVVAAVLGAGPWAAAPAVVGLVAKLAKDRQGRYLPLVLPLLQKLLKIEEALRLQESGCEERFIVVGAGTGRKADSTVMLDIQVLDPDSSKAPAGRAVTMWRNMPVLLDAAYVQAVRRGRW